MGPMCFDYGFGPFRWVCTSGKPEDLAYTDQLAADVLEKLLDTAPDSIRPQLSDNLHWGARGFSKQAGGWLAGPHSLCRCTRQNANRPGF